MGKVTEMKQLFIHSVIFLNARLLAAFVLFAAHTVQAQVPALKDLSPVLKQSNTALVRSTLPSDDSRVDVVTFDAVTKAIKTRTATIMHCERVHMGGASIFCFGMPKGLNGVPDQTPDTHKQYQILNYALKPRTQNNFDGSFLVSRARMSSDGLFAASTVFTKGDSYMPGMTAQISTRAHIYSVASKTPVPDLERWAIFNKGQPLMPMGLNVWGVTFDPKNSALFYATVMAQNNIYLVKGNVNSRNMEVIAADIECPSFSPDGTRLAFKQRKTLGGWNAAVYTIQTGKITVFEAPYSVDDQIEWLDNQTLVFEKKTITAASATVDLMVRDAQNPTLPARLWLANAGSPTFVRAQ